MSNNNWWFSAFRQQGGPTWYGDNRTPVITDTTTVKIAVLFGIFLIAFLVIFPGIRRAKWTSFISITLALVVGAIIVVCIYHPSWYVAEMYTASPYKAFSSDRLNALLGVNVGLKYVNITLKGAPEHEIHHHLNYNERFTFYEVKSMQHDLHEGLQKGLPYPILSVIEYLSVDKAGFVWGRRYRLAGYYTCILLWLSFALWLLHLLMLCLIPQFYSRTLMCLGVCITLADLVYVLSCPKNLYIPFANVQGSNQALSFQLGWCFWTTVAAGVTCFIFGAIIRILEAKALCKFSTFLQLDFDELYDNAGNLQTANINTINTNNTNNNNNNSEDRLYQERIIVALSQTSPDPGPALIQGKDQFVEVDEMPKPSSSKLPKSSSMDDGASSSSGIGAIGRRSSSPVKSVGGRRSSSPVKSATANGSSSPNSATSSKTKHPEVLELNEHVDQNWSSVEAF